METREAVVPDTPIYTHTLRSRAHHRALARPPPRATGPRPTRCIVAHGRGGEGAYVRVWCWWGGEVARAAPHRARRDKQQRAVCPRPAALGGGAERGTRCAAQDAGRRKRRRTARGTRAPRIEAERVGQVEHQHHRQNARSHREHGFKFLSD